MTLLGFAASVARAFVADEPRPTRFSYEAVASSTKRRPISGTLRSEDAELSHRERELLQVGARDLPRNFAVARWMVKKHLDYVTSHRFRCRLPDPLGGQVESLMRRWARRDRCDVKGRDRLQKLIRSAEARRVIDGDVLILRTKGNRLQIIEADRVRSKNANELPPELDQYRNGVKVDAVGQLLSFSVCRRVYSDAVWSPANESFIFDRTISARDATLFAYRDREDQIRGVTPLAAAINPLRDTHEAAGYALAKMKLAQMLGLTVYSEAKTPYGTVTDEGEEDAPKYKWNPDAALWKLELDPGDRAEMLESKNPSTEFQAFWQSQIMLALKALGIPYGFWDEREMNFSNSKSCQIQYDAACREAREDVGELLDEITDWRLKNAIATGELPDFDVDARPWEWQHVGIPWIDPVKEAQGAIAAIEAGLDSRTRVCKARGLDFYELADELAEEAAYAKEKGITLSATAPQITQEPPPDGN